MAIRQRLSNSSQIRFWNKVVRTRSCWLWTAAKNEKGYGVFGLGQETDKAHRIAWRLINGLIPQGLFVLHRCDVPACVNPKHLFLGTNIDNVRDMIAKGRNSKPPAMGGWNKIFIPKSILNELGHRPDTELAKRMGVSKYVIQRTRRARAIKPHPPTTCFQSGQPHPRWGTCRKGG